MLRNPSNPPWHGFVHAGIWNQISDHVAPNPQSIIGWQMIKTIHEYDIMIYIYICICVYVYIIIMIYYYIIWYAPFFPIPVDELHLFLVGCRCTVHRWHSLAFDPSLAARVEMSPSGESSLRLAGVFRLVDFRIFFRLVLLNVLFTGPSFLVGSKILLFRFCSEWWMMMNFYLTLTCWRRQPELPFLESLRIPRHLGLNIFMLLVVGIRLERYHGHWRTLVSWESNILVGVIEVAMDQISDMWSGSIRDLSWSITYLHYWLEISRNIFIMALTCFFWPLLTIENLVSTASYELIDWRVV